MAASTRVRRVKLVERVVFIRNSFWALQAHYVFDKLFLHEHCPQYVAQPGRTTCIEGCVVGLILAVCINAHGEDCWRSASCPA